MEQIIYQMAIVDREGTEIGVTSKLDSEYLEEICSIIVDHINKYPKFADVFYSKMTEKFGKSWPDES